ncbi:MAG TPA: hypothetical protein VKA21_15935 [Candidatus Binatia bacterium]|nr:hypothetical protein [Candidatus Binatia bacterium]
MRARTAERLALASGLLLGPIAWFATLETAYVLVPWACARGSVFPIHAVIAAGLVATAVAAGLAWPARRRFAGTLGVALNALFFLAILAQGAAGVVLGPCE